MKKLKLPILLITSMLIASAFTSTSKVPIVILKDSSENTVTASVNSEKIPHKGQLALEIEIAEGIWVLYDVVPLTKEETSFEVKCNHNYQVRLIDASTGYMPFAKRDEIKSNKLLKSCQENANMVQLYPNPAINELHIDNLSDMTLKNVKIYSSQGQLVLEPQSASKIAINSLTPDVYFVHITAEDGSIITSKFVKI